ncbi:nucleotidyltransferase domain-containing protein [Enterococcus nangangensis]|uniref:nucleotidyltransferase domain-containing protein n=1 Tax=Enterococcus nangangensis TaxID=2559926 RepID=UPI0010F57EF3|nr:nucleotidyltransferase domain-containing protein [Enterococcus nangangensis]
MTKNNEITDYVLKRITEDFHEDIALLLLYGSALNGTANSYSDVDLYFIPRTKRGYQLGETFILADIGYDFFGMTWERLTRIADFEDNLSPLVGDVQILFAHSSAEKRKFLHLQQQMTAHLTDRTYMHHRALARLTSAKEIFFQLLQAHELSAIRKFAGQLLMSIAEVCAYENQTYFRKGLKEQFIDLKKMPKLPQNFLVTYQSIIKENNPAKIKADCQEIFFNTRQFLGLKEEQLQQVTATSAAVRQDRVAASASSSDYLAAADWFQELISTFNKIYFCATNKNYPLAFISACALQTSLEEDLQIKLKTKDLLSTYQFDDLSVLAKRTKEIEEDCRYQIAANQILLRDFSTMDELIQQKRKRLRN